MDSKHGGSQTNAIELLDLGDDQAIKSDSGYGNEKDISDMFRMGKKQELKRNFRFISIVAFLTVMQATWESALLANWYGLFNGGTAGTIYMLLAVWLCMVATMACMAELASMAPTAGGQYHWISEFAPKSMQQPLSYIVGWFAFFSWVASIPACAQILAGMTQAIALLAYPNLEISALWQTTLLVFAWMALIFSFNIFAAKWLPIIENMMLVLHVVAFLIFIFILAFLPKHIPTERVFTEFYDGGGWGSIGLSTLAGIVTPLWCFVGPDAGAHMSEELHDASYQLPRAMILATVGNGILAIPMIIVFCRCITNLQDALNSDYALFDILYSSTGSYAATCVLFTMLILLYSLGTCNVIAASSRQCWAFARDGGFPYSKWITQIKHGQPLNAMFICIAVSYALACINFGSDVALNAILSVSNAALLFTYIVSIGCITLKRIRGETLLPRQWDLGRFGLPLNLFCLAFLLICFVLSFFPIAPSVGDPTWGADFNWACLMFVAVWVLAWGYFVLYGKRSYIPSVRLVKELEIRLLLR